MKTNQDLYVVTAEQTIIDDTPEDVQTVWNGIWDAVYVNYLDSIGTMIRGFADCGFDSKGLPNAFLTNQFCTQHAISQQIKRFMPNNSTRNLCLVTVGTLTREFTDCILRNIFQVLGSFCRQGFNVKIQCGRVGVFLFNNETKFYQFKFNVISKKHPEYRDERLCEIENKKDCYDQGDQFKHTDKISFKSSVKPIMRPKESFDVTKVSGYMGIK
ncbi:hypothetical protein SS50377_27950 [Spironucleus salmonicida]|uniref:Uncharacterized protein n=1 Tax=Spironucleus salmonicida TaxID=348837 RepID=V6LFM8_9EUKA|nr:hypothetical protein SS50377_27950 [Spironucleus salmonicida]|eukprot:EST42511.1 hypothetical protein SS50377_17818 [Spironucleus salmonicida]